MQEPESPRFVQLSHGDCLLHFNLRCRQGAQDRGIRLRLRTTRKSGEAPECDVCAEGGVGVIVQCVLVCSSLRSVVVEMLRN